jgi:hypothetical protein
MTDPQPSDDQTQLLILVRDLMFSSRITAAAREAGVSFLVVRDPASLPMQTGKRLIIDLAQDGAIEAAVAWKSATGGHTVGFVSHVEGETIARARAVGIDQVLSRGQFTQQLESLVLG